jgi:hypothetical protein
MMDEIGGDVSPVFIGAFEPPKARNRFGPRLVLPAALRLV